VRLRAEEVVERGLRLYAHGDLVGALAEWRRALELDHGNRRGRDYVAYVEDHFDVLSERFAAARERSGIELQPLDLAIEIEAEDPMDDMDPYESLELDSPPSGAAGEEAAGGDEDFGESTAPAPEGPNLQGAAAGGKVGAGRRPWGRRLAGDLDGEWPMDDSWPASRSNDTLEMAVDPSVLDDLDDLIAGGPGPESDLDGEVDADEDIEADGTGGADVADSVEEADVVDEADVDEAGVVEADAEEADVEEADVVDDVDGVGEAYGAVGPDGVDGAPGAGGEDGAGGAGGDDGVLEADGVVGAVGVGGAVGAVGAHGAHGAHGAVGAEAADGADAPVSAEGAEDAVGAGADLDGVDGLLDGLDRDLAAGVQTIDEVLEAVDAVDDDDEEEDEEATGPDEKTMPARASRRPYGSVPGIPTAEGSGQLGGAEFGYGAGRAGRAPMATDEAWADGTPTVEPVEMDGERVGDIHELGPDELREVRVTFRRSNRASEAHEDGAAPAAAPARSADPGADQDAGADDADDDEPVRDIVDSQPTDADVESYLSSARIDDEDSGEGSDPERDDDDVDEEELTIERDGVSARETEESLRRRTTPRPLPPRTRTETDRGTTQMHGRRRPLAHRSISIDLVSADLQAELEAAMAAAESTGDEHLRERIAWLIERARHENGEGRYPNAVVAVDLALDENPESALAQKLIHSNRDLLFEIFGNYLGDMRAVPRLAMPMSAIPLSDLDHRAAFLLSRVDGVLSLEDVLDVAGMARLEAFRHLSRLMLRGILELRP